MLSKIALLSSPPRLFVRLNVSLHHFVPHVSNTHTYTHTHTHTHTHAHTVFRII